MGRKLRQKKKIILFLANHCQDISFRRDEQKKIEEKMLEKEK